MSMTEQEAQYEQWMADLYEEHSKEAVAQFTLECLQSYYLKDPLLASAPFRSLTESRVLLADHPSAALVFAATAVEVGMSLAIARIASRTLANLACCRSAPAPEVKLVTTTGCCCACGGAPACATAHAMQGARQRTAVATPASRRLIMSARAASRFHAARRLPALHNMQPPAGESEGFVERPPGAGKEVRRG